MFSRIQFVTYPEIDKMLTLLHQTLALNQKNNYEIASSHVCCNPDKLVAQAPPERFTVSRKMNAFKNLEEAVELRQ